MNEKIKTKHLILFIIIAALLLYITESWFMAMGVMIVLIIIDVALAEYIYHKRNDDEEDS